MADLELWSTVVDGDGPPVLFIHGIVASAATWAVNLETLRRACTPVIVQLWGHGGAPSPEHEAAYGVPAYIEAFERLRERLGVNNWVVVGQSLGGALALHYGLARPDRVAAVAFTNAVAALSREDKFAAMTPQLIESAARLEGPNGRALLDADDRNPTLPGRGQRLPAGARDQIRQEWLLHDPAGIGRAYKWTLPQLPLRSRLHEFQVPVLLVRGVKEETFTPLANVAGKAIPGIEIVDADAGHLVNLHAPETFATTVAAFISRQRV